MQAKGKGKYFTIIISREKRYLYVFAVVYSVSVAGHLLVAHLDVVHTHEISAVVQVLFEVTVLEDSHSVHISCVY